MSGWTRLRIPNGRLIKRAWEANSVERRPLGRSTLRWSDIILEHLKLWESTTGRVLSWIKVYAEGRLRSWKLRSSRTTLGVCS
ncbi:hypothetical protein WA026_016162 [Henosepilachna vigintioctopunctata]|uniref:Uncharacterized protein n=1 Tax=Henosepilachna vigintioctopunctata TaxID=420089 RepID=A0AAW1TWP1_9CUCU